MQLPSSSRLDNHPPTIQWRISPPPTSGRPARFHLATASLRQAHDALPLYRSVSSTGTSTRSSRSMSATRPLSIAPPLRRDEDATPICLAEQPMLYQGYCAQRMRLKWRCPPSPRKAALATCPTLLTTVRTPPMGARSIPIPAKNRTICLFPSLRRTHRSGIARRPSPRAPSVPSNAEARLRLDHTCIAGRERWFFRVMLAACVNNSTPGRSTPEPTLNPPACAGPHSSLG